MFGIGPMELLLIMVVALLVLGPKRMPELARTLGRGLSEFRRASNDLRQSLALDEIQNDLREGISGAGTIQRPAKRPEAEDRPAQAGDDLESGDPTPSAPSQPPGPDEQGDETSGPIHNQASTPNAATPPATPPATPEATPEATPPAAPLPPTKTTTPATPATPATGSDDLGNVPVGRSARPAQPAQPDPTDEPSG